jgi:hypothetical protein
MWNSYDPIKARSNLRESIKESSNSSELLKSSTLFLFSFSGKQVINKFYRSLLKFKFAE